MKKRMPVHTVRPDSITIILPAAIRVYDQMENPSYDDAIAIWVLQEKMLDARYDVQDYADSMRVCRECARHAEDFEYNSECLWEAHCYEGYMEDAIEEYLDARGKLLALL